MQQLKKGAVHGDELCRADTDGSRHGPLGVRHLYGQELHQHANLLCPEPDVRTVDFDEKRELDRLLTTELSARGLPSVPKTRCRDPDETGGIHLARALAKAARPMSHAIALRQTPGF